MNFQYINDRVFNERVNTYAIKNKKNCISSNQYSKKLNFSKTEKHIKKEYNDDESVFRPLISGYSQTVN